MLLTRDFIIDRYEITPSPSGSGNVLLTYIGLGKPIEGGVGSLQGSDAVFPREGGGQLRFKAVPEELMAFLAAAPSILISRSYPPEPIVMAGATLAR